MFEHGFPPEWSTIKKLIWLKGSGILGAAGEVWETVSGAIVSFVTRRSAALQKLEVAIEPVQSGSGDPSPTNIRPITGWTGCEVNATGENLANVNAQTAQIGYYISASGGVTADQNNWIYKNYIPVKASTAYTLSFDQSVYYVSISEYSSASDAGFIQRDSGSTGSNTKLTITTGANTKYIRFGTNIDRTTVTLEEVLAIHWMLNEGSTASAYKPFGTTYSVTFPANGANLISFVGVAQKTNNGVTYTANADGSITVYGTASPNTSFGIESSRVSVKAGTYTFTTHNADNVRTVMTNAAGTMTNILLDGTGSKTVTLESDDTIYLYVRVNKNNAADTTMTVELQSHEVYSGTLDVLTGKLTVTHGIIHAKDIAWVRDTTQSNPNGTYFYKNNITLPFKSWSGTTKAASKSNALVPSSNTSSTASGANTFWWNGYSDAIRIVWGTANGGSSLDDFKTFLTDNDVVIYSVLKNSVEYTLTGQEVSTLVGNNTMWADTGDIEVTYLSN